MHAPIPHPSEFPGQAGPYGGQLPPAFDPPVAQRLDGWSGQAAGPSPNPPALPMPQSTGDGEAAGSFTPILFDPPAPGASRKGLYFLGGCVALIVLGVLWQLVKPESTEAKSEPPPPDYTVMTVDQLVQNASPGAAHELAKRMVNGQPADQAAAAVAIRNCSNPRLARNLAMAIALEQQKKQKQMMQEIERQVEFVEGY